MARVSMVADNISCPHCAMAIKREVGGVDGILAVQVDVPTRVVTLEYTDEQALDRAKALLEDIGYPVHS